MLGFGFGWHIPLADKLKARVSVFLGLAAAYERRGKYEKAEAYFSKAMKADSKLQRL